MATSTPHLLLRKPDPSDLANVTTDISQNLDKIDTGAAAIAKPPRCRVVRSTAQVIAHATVVPLIWSSAEYDTAAMWAAGNPSRLTAPVAGTYRCMMGAQYAIGGVGGLRILIMYRQPSGLTIATQQHNTSASWYAGGAIGADMWFNAGDWLECAVYHDNGANWNISPDYPIWGVMRLVSVN